MDKKGRVAFTLVVPTDKLHIVLTFIFLLNRWFKPSSLAIVTKMTIERGGEERPVKTVP